MANNRTGACTEVRVAWQSEPISEPKTTWPVVGSERVPEPKAWPVEGLEFGPEPAAAWTVIGSEF